MMTELLFLSEPSLETNLYYIYMSNSKISEGNLIELQCGLPQLNRKVPLCLFLCISSWSSVKTLLCCSFLYFLSTFMSPRCLHSLFTRPSAASNLSVCLSSRFGPSFIFPSTELCILLLHPPRSTERMISHAASHLQQSHPISLPCLEPWPHTSKHQELKWEANTSLLLALFLSEWNLSFEERTIFHCIYFLSWNISS